MNPKSMIMVGVGDVVDLTSSKECLAKRSGQRNLRAVVYSEANNCHVTIFAKESAIGLKVGRITKILAVQYFPITRSKRLWHMCTIICEMEDAEGETPNLVSDVGWREHGKSVKRAEGLPEFTYGSVNNAKEKEE